jgi:hypothetical protein
MSHTNWWQQGRGDISRGSHGRGYPRYASQIYSQGNNFKKYYDNCFIKLSDILAVA